MGVDFVTQNLLGAVAGHAALGRPHRDGGLGRLALLAGALGGAVPDFDFLLKPFADPAVPMEFHRHLTHALVFIPVGGLIASLPFLVTRRGRRQFGLVYAAATVGCATHGLLDNLTSYGTHLLWPFMQDRTAWDAMAIIDPLFTGLLFVSVIVTLFRGSPRTTRTAMVLALMYIALGFVQHARAVGVQRDLARERGHEIRHGRAHPMPFSFIVFRSVYEAEGRLWADAIRIDPLGGAGVREGVSTPRFVEADLPVNATPRAREVFGKFERFADGMVGTVELPDGGLAVGDMRISMSTTDFLPMWGISIDDHGEPHAWRTFHDDDERAKRVLDELFNDVFRPQARFMSPPEAP
jgi:inner membrane protein